MDVEQLKPQGWSLSLQWKNLIAKIFGGQAGQRDWFWPLPCICSFVGADPAFERAAEALDARRDPMRLGALGAGDRVADIVVLSSLLRLGTFFLLVTIPQFVPSWDTSARPLLPASTHVEGLLRWDTLHFVGIAEREDGKHEVEKEWAFGRGIVEVLRIGEKIMAPWKAGDDSIEVRRERMVVGGSVLASAASMASGVVLYQFVFPVSP